MFISSTALIEADLESGIVRNLLIVSLSTSVMAAIARWILQFQPGWSMVVVANSVPNGYVSYLDQQVNDRCCATDLFNLYGDVLSTSNR